MAKMGEKTFASSHFCGKWNMGKRGKGNERDTNGKCRDEI
jgi:hypothetical protein